MHEHENLQFLICLGGAARRGRDCSRRRQQQRHGCQETIIGRQRLDAMPPCERPAAQRSYRCHQFRLILKAEDDIERVPTKPSMTVAAWQMERSDLGHSDQPGQTVARGNVAPCRILSRWSRFQKESGVCSLSCGGGYPQARWCRWIPRRCGSPEAASLSRATAGRDSPSLTRLRRLVAAATNTGRRSHCGNAAPDSGGGAYRFRQLSCGSSNGRKSRRVGSVGCSDGTATHRMSGKVRVQRDSVIASAAIPSLRAPRSSIPKRARAVLMSAAGDRFTAPAGSIPSWPGSTRPIRLNRSGEPGTERPDRHSADGRA